MGGLFYIEISNFGYFKKQEKSDYRRKQLKMLSLKKQSTGLQQLKITAIKNHKNNIDENYIAQKMSTFKQQINICSFFAQKVGHWIGGWVGGWMLEPG